MSGKLTGVQKRLQGYAENALYVHCSAHNLNLVLCDAAESCTEVKSFFGVVQETYNHLGGSAPRWATLRAVGDEMTEKLLKQKDKKLLNGNLDIKQCKPYYQ